MGHLCVKRFGIAKTIIWSPSEGVSPHFCGWQFQMPSSHPCGHLLSMGTNALSNLMLTTKTEYSIITWVPRILPPTRHRLIMPAFYHNCPDILVCISQWCPIRLSKWLYNATIVIICGIKSAKILVQSLLSIVHETKPGQMLYLIT